MSTVDQENGYKISKAVDDDDDDDDTESNNNNNNNMKCNSRARTQRQAKKRLGYSTKVWDNEFTSAPHTGITGDTSTYHFPWLSLSVTPSWSNRSLSISRCRAPVRDHLCIC